MTWQSQAACASVEDPDIFFPHQGQPSANALTICASCPVRTKCFEAFKNEEFGIFGGATEAQRREVRGVKPRRPNKKSPCVVCNFSTALYSVFGGRCYDCFRKAAA